MAELRSAGASYPFSLFEGLACAKRHYAPVIPAFAVMTAKALRLATTRGRLVGLRPLFPRPPPAEDKPGDQPEQGGPADDLDRPITGRDWLGWRGRRDGRCRVGRDRGGRPGSGLRNGRRWDIARPGGEDRSCDCGQGRG